MGTDYGRSVLVNWTADWGVQTLYRKPCSGFAAGGAWNPPFCGDIDMRIARDGLGFTAARHYQAALVRLFSTILRKDPTAMFSSRRRESWHKGRGRRFLAVEMTSRAATGAGLRFSTNVGMVEAGPEHPCDSKSRFRGLKPYIHVRGDLWALATRTCL